MAVKTFSGGEALEARLREIADRIGKVDTVRVGFLEGATYPNGMSVAQVAATNEYGGTIDVPEHTTTIYRSVKADGSFNKNGKFVKASKSNFATSHTVPAHTITIPARAFFRGMVTKNKGDWGSDLGKIVRGANYDSAIALARMGKMVAEQLQDAIRSFSSPGNAQSTIKSKGFDKPLIHSSHMLNSVDSEVETK